MATQNQQLRAVFDRDGAVIFDLKGGELSTLNPTGAFVWRKLQDHESIEQIIGDLAAETGEEIPVVRRDVTEFVNSLKRKHLLMD